MATSLNYLKGTLGNANIKAALSAIRMCEGTNTADGYNYLFGSAPNNKRRFTDMSKHPNERYPFTIGGETQYSSAAGAYQILKGTYNTLCKKYGFTDFTPMAQDLMAVALFDSVGVLNDVAAGKFFDPTVIDRLNNIWASLPAAGYGQPEKPISMVRKYYTDAGGVMAVLV